MRSNAASDNTVIVLSVHLTKHDIDAADDGDDVGYQVSSRHLRKRLQVVERWGSHVEPIRLSATITHEIVAHLTTGALDGTVDLTWRRLQPFGEQLEVVDKRLHARDQLIFGWWDNLAIVDPPWP